VKITRHKKVSNWIVRKLKNLKFVKLGGRRAIPVGLDELNASVN
jgi:hypothetical protein